MIVHVIKKSGTRFQYGFPDSASPEEVLGELERVKHVFGFNGTVKKPDPNAPVGAPPTDFEDSQSGFAWDNPETVVAVLETERIGDNEKPKLDPQGNVIEVKRIRGPVKTQGAKASKTLAE